MRNSLFIMTILLAIICLQGCSGSQTGQQGHEKPEQAQEAESEAGSGSTSEYAVVHPAYLEKNTPAEEINCWGYRSVVNRYYRHISGRPHQDTGTIR